MNRRGFVAAIGGAAALPPRAVAAVAGPARLESTADRLPRKVIVGTHLRNFRTPYPGLDRRLEQLTELIDGMAAQSRQKYGRGLDLAILSEAVVNGAAGMPVSCAPESDPRMACALPYEGKVKDVFARKAVEQRCYIVVSMKLLENREKRLYSNASLLIDRKGETIGIYRKLHLAASRETGRLERGTTPGKEVPVFDCDFGRLGIQICYDMQFDYGWEQLARKGAELVAWPTQGPDVILPAFRAMQHRYHIVSSSWRDNASVFDPRGRIAAQITPPESVLAHEIDLSYSILAWGLGPRPGPALKKKYGDKVGYRHAHEDYTGIYWSNDPQTSIAQMARSLNLPTVEDELEYARSLYRKAGVPGY